MSRWIYNGITMDRGQVFWRKQTKLDGRNTYLYTTLTLTFRGMYNPNLNSYRPSTTIPVTAVAQGFTIDQSQISNPAQRIPGSAPATEAAIRHLLMQPREQFILNQDNIDVLRVPANNVTVDCNNGPIPISAKVTQVHGRKTFDVEHVIELAINEAPANQQAQVYSFSPLLSHEWTMVHDIDADFFTTRYIIGRAVFRADMMQLNALIPDQLRYWMSHPVPKFMRRQSVKVKALPDGNTIEYAIVDRERYLIYDPNLITRLEAYYTVHTSAPGLENFLLSGNLAGAAVMAGGAALIRLLEMQPRVNVNGVNLPDLAIPDLSSGQWIALFGATPRTSHHCNIKAWGHPRASKRAILTEIQRLIADRFSRIPDQALRRVLGGFGRKTTIDDSGVFIEVDEIVNGSVIAQVIDAVVGNRLDAPDGPASQINVLLPNPVRGAYLGACVAQALRDTNTTGTRPQEPPRVKDVGTGNVMGTLPSSAAAGISQPW